MLLYNQVTVIEEASCFHYIIIDLDEYKGTLIKGMTQPFLDNITGL
jgi:hypothetical protein